MTGQIGKSRYSFFVYMYMWGRGDDCVLGQETGGMLEVVALLVGLRGDQLAQLGGHCVEGELLLQGG